MKGRQFVSTPLVCPNCGHILGEQAYFQSFEAKVAAWLHARLAPPATKGYDVHDSLLVPGKTFQVKYANVARRARPNTQFPSVTWAWIAKRLDPIHPNFFVLFGIDEMQDEHCFLFSRDDFINYAHRQKNGMYILRATAKKASDRPNYRYVPKIWHHVIGNPEVNLAEYALNYQQSPNRTVFASAYTERVRAMREDGVSQRAIADQLSISQTSVHRILKGSR